MKTSEPRAALGFSVHTGWAAVVAVGGPPAAPVLLAKGRIDVATTFDEGAVFHAAQELPIEKARALVARSEARFAARARTELDAFVARLGAPVAGAGLAAPAAKALPPFESIVRSHPLVHAAEGELYRRVFAAAASSVVGAPPPRIPPATLAARTAAALGVAPAHVAGHLAAMGKASGKPWAADQKHAALAAWLGLLTAGRAGGAR
jgi:hypothetical protein